MCPQVAAGLTFVGYVANGRGRLEGGGRRVAAALAIALDKDERNLKMQLEDALKHWEDDGTPATTSSFFRVWHKLFLPGLTV